LQLHVNLLVDLGFDSPVAYFFPLSNITTSVFLSIYFSESLCSLNQVCLNLRSKTIRFGSNSQKHLARKKEYIAAEHFQYCHKQFILKSPSNRVFSSISDPGFKPVLQIMFRNPQTLQKKQVRPVVTPKCLSTHHLRLLTLC
jgi:hypothetical protein